MPAHLALEEQFDPFSFVKYIKVIGRGYQRQAIELVMICRLFVEVSPQENQHDAKFKEAMFAADVALRYATDAGKKTTDAASNAFDEALKKLLLYEANAHPSSSVTVNIAARMTRAKETDERSLGRFNRLKAKLGVHTPNDSPTLPVNFVLLKSLTDPEPLIVHQILSTQPMSSEILWNFSRYTDDRRIALRQNPHFYLDLPTSGDAYGAGFSKNSMRDFVLRHEDTVYVLVDKPDLCRVYLEVEATKQKRIFGNVWMQNRVLIFKDIRGKLEGEQLVGNDMRIQSRQELFWRNEPNIPDICLKRFSAIPQELPTLPEAWMPVTDNNIRDWKELIHKKTLPSTRVSVKVCVSHADHPVDTNDEVPRAPDKQAADVSRQTSNVPSATNPTLGSSSVHIRPQDEFTRLIQVKVPRAPDKQAADASCQTSNVPSATNPTLASSSVHIGPQDANPRISPAHGADAQYLPQTQVPLVPVLPNRRPPGSQSIDATVPSHPVPRSSVSPPAPVQARESPISLSTMTPSSPPLPAHHSKPPATEEPQKNVPSPHAPAPPSSFPGTNPPSKPIEVTPITHPGPGNRTAQHSHPQPVSNNVKPAIRDRTKADKPAQDGKGPTKSTKSSFSFTSFTHILKPLSMPGGFPGPQMDVDWVMVAPGPAEAQGGNWVKRLFRRHS